MTVLHSAGIKPAGTAQSRDSAAEYGEVSRRALTGAFWTAAEVWGERHCSLASSCSCHAC
jgi:hypothetical protein